jgi:dihydrofolate synthase/folylpolyglutamate synthase
LDYPDVIAYFHSLTDYEKTRIERYTPETLSLARVELLLSRLDSPHLSFRSVHIAGTKGKGSTAAMIESCLRAAGLRTGLYTSPHLHTFRERIQANGRMISREEVVLLASEVRDAVERTPGATTFEAITALGFLYFARVGIDVGVVEVGLGGRLDATNVVTPEVAVITSVSLDHTYLLGDTLAEIAFEKAGIVKCGVPAVSAPQRPEAARVIREVCKARDAPLTVVGRDWEFEAGRAALDGQSFRMRHADRGQSSFEGEFWLPLLGRHQLENAAAAIATLNVLKERGFDISVEAVRDGLGTVQWPGRLEILSTAPLVVADCAHNPYSIRVLSQALEDWFPGRRWTVVFGASVDKDIPGMLSALLPISEHLLVTRSDHPRAAAPIRLADMAAEAGGGAEVSVSVRRAIERALEIDGPASGVLVTGSIFVVADAREAWALFNGDPIPEGEGESVP